MHAAVMILDIETQNKFGYEQGDGEGFVNLPHKISDVVVSALFTEQKDFFRVSLRSKGEFSVNDFARKYFNGGGHKNAAGGRLPMKKEQIEEYYAQSLKQFIEDNSIVFEE